MSSIIIYGHESREDGSEGSLTGGRVRSLRGRDVHLRLHVGTSINRHLPLRGAGYLTGLIFASFMVCITIGGVIYSALGMDASVESYSFLCLGARLRRWGILPTLPRRRAGPSLARWGRGTYLSDAAPAQVP